MDVWNVFSYSDRFEFCGSRFQDRSLRFGIVKGKVLKTRLLKLSSRRCESSDSDNS